jgi:hypothetical protein
MGIPAGSNFLCNPEKIAGMKNHPISVYSVKLRDIQRSKKNYKDNI